MNAENPFKNSEPEDTPDNVRHMFGVPVTDAHLAELKADLAKVDEAEQAALRESDGDGSDGILCW